VKPHVFLPAILSGVLLWMSFYPMNLGFLAYIALVPFLSLVRAEGVSARRRYSAAFVGGLVFYVPALQWIRVAHPAMYASWIGLSLGCACFHPIALFLLRRLDRLGKPPLAITVAIVWVALEYVRAHFPVGYSFLKPLGMHQLVGFAWYFLGHTQHAYSMMIQIADLGGVYLITFMVAACNGALAEWVFRMPMGRLLLNWPKVHQLGFFRELWTTAVAVLLFLVSYGYGASRLIHPDFEQGPRVSALQADFSQDLKSSDPKKLWDEYNKLCENASTRRPDLIVWPETCYPIGYTLLDLNNSAKAELPDDVKVGLKDNRDLQNHAFRNWRTNVLLGSSLEVWNGERLGKFNSAILLEPDGRYAERYDKMHLVPFGEYVPFRETLPFMNWFTPYRSDYSCTPGEKMTRFAIMSGETQYTFGTLICYEDSDPYLARQYNQKAGDERPVDFLVNISNDGWFRGTEEHEQHLAICKFRAVEARRSIVRAVNVGISAIINSDGIIQALPHNSVKESLHWVGPVTDKIRLDTRESFYAKVGDWAPAACWVLIVLGLILSRRKARAT
jgi:apolipoprotein N-acyltransferase